MQLEVTAVAGPGMAPFPALELSLFVPEAVPWRPPPGAGGGQAEATVGIRQAAKGGAQPGRGAWEALAARWPGANFSVAGRPVAGLRPGNPPLVDGAVVVVHPGPLDPEAKSHGETGRASGGGLHARGAPALLAVRSGPAAGAMFPLQRGSYTLGRGRCRIPIPDPTLSRFHGTLDVGESAMTLTPARGSTGFRVVRGWDRCPTADATPVKGAVDVQVGDLVSCGMTGFAILLDVPGGIPPGPEATPATARPEAAGHVPGMFAPETPVAGVPGTGEHAMPPTRWPGLLDPGVLRPVSLDAPAGMSRGRWAMVAAGLLPLVVGVLFAWLTGSWMFLAFAGMGAVTVLVPLLGGARHRRDFSAVVADAARRDAARRMAAFPGADEFLATAQAATAENPESAPPPAPDLPAVRGIAVRLGTATQATNVVLVPASPGFLAPVASGLPVAVPLPGGTTHLRGAAPALALLLNFVLMQLDAAAVPVVLLGAPDRVPLCARFLRNTVLATTSESAIEAVQELCPSGIRAEQSPPPDPTPNGTESGPPCVLVAVDMSATAVEATCPGLRIVAFTGGIAAGVPAAATLRAQGNCVVGAANGVAFVPDGVPALLFDRYARARARSATTTTPRRNSLEPCRVPPLSNCTPEAVARQWAATTNRPLASVPIGQSPAGPELFDFSRHGPHLLVGGTTGSGKSEFLRTLVGSLAATHSPADLQFVFIDFKGGAGLGAMQKLPHTTSLVTDLDGHGIARTIASLRAEIHKRESMLGHAEAADSDSYRSAHAGRYAGMAHLMIVVDEFRVLVDQFPDAMAELMRIAAVGRSLGIHLVMATQRPQGAINADIRANVTSSVCLRVQTTFDSQDVIGTGSAATISVGTPGRAYISRAGARPTQFQCATLRLPDKEPASRPVALATADVLGQGAGQAAIGHADSGTADRTPDSDIAPVAAMLTDAWELYRAGSAAEDGPPPAAPAVVAPDLPAVVDVAAQAPSALAGPDLGQDAAMVAVPDGSGPGLALGVVDVPEAQTVEPLLWCPATHSHVACVGTQSEASAAVGLLACQFIRARSTEPGTVPHFAYILDGDGSLQAFAGDPAVGGYATPHRLRTAARLLQRLAGLAGSDSAFVVLFASDWGRWLAGFRSSPWPWAEDAMTGLVRHGGRRISVVLGGDRELLTAPFMASIPNRLFLPHRASTESTILWPKLPRFAPLPGRAAVFGPINAAASGGLPDDPHTAQLGQAAATSSPSSRHRLHAGPVSHQGNVLEPLLNVATGAITGRRVSGNASHRGPLPPEPPIVVCDLPEGLTLGQARDTIRGLQAQRGSSSGGDRNSDGNGDAHGNRNSSPATSQCQGEASLFVGLGGDGRTPISVRIRAGTVLPLFGGPGSGRSSFLRSVRALNEPEPDVGLEQPGPPIVWVDDAITLDPVRLSEVGRQLDQGAVAVVALPNHLPSLSRLPLEWGLRNMEHGIILGPKRAQDGEMLGVRLDTPGSEPAGRAVLVERGNLEWFQFPFADIGRAGE
ncbi:FtsK/SpoIIIE domain-containing protein [Arthrobacter sp. A2-55]|uniref:FtsK/SpoIIIE domain-containing protein n=1 Tax=Arthrobacter sp. A2-55 TaxID=2897337 RepID=UPI0021CD3643|nr:FtsK/SpoIIIE domain-containing protein [Arthrobacter sp. A2-55]MCU6480065.1 hypothetical protein [Arthrobacter sp. A2-55]